MKGRLPEGSCSALWDEMEVPAAGTAMRGSFVVALEQPGPWGSKAFVQSRLDPAVGAELQDRVLAAGGRPLLIRRPGDHDEVPGAPRRVFVAGGMARRPWLLTGLVTDPAEVLALPFERLATGFASEIAEEVPWLEEVAWLDEVPVASAAAPSRDAVPARDGLSSQDRAELDPAAEAVPMPVRTPNGVPGVRSQAAGAPPALLLVCTNAKRDRCCALRGRPIAAACAAERPDAVWESSHLGGHRFAPTVLLLPTGQALGRVDPDLAIAALDAASEGRFFAAGPMIDRGRMCLEPAEQVADVLLRAATGEDEPESFGFAPGNGGVVALHRDGRTWTVDVTSREVEGIVSCGKESTTTKVWEGTIRPSLTRNRY